MTVRQFAVFYVRFQALEMIFSAFINTTHLPGYIRRYHAASPYSQLFSEARLEAFLAVLRIILDVAAAVALIQYADRIIDWTMKDLIPTLRSDPPTKPAPAMERQ
jgi:hypothetical protein